MGNLFGEVFSINRISYELGRNLAKMRRRAGLTQTQLADQLSEVLNEQISMHKVSNWERGLVDLPACVIPAACEAIHCTSFDLYPHSRTLSDRDVQLISTIMAMGETEKEELYYLLHEWNGDRKALLKLDVLHAVQDPDMRYAADKLIINGYLDAVSRGFRGIDRRIKVDVNYVRRAFRHLLDR